MIGFNINKLRINTLGVVRGIYISGTEPVVIPQYLYFDDGITYMRKGTRVVDEDQLYGVDVKLTETGWSGEEDTDFEMIYPNIV